MLDVVERLMVERGVVIVAREEMFGTLIIETDDPLMVSRIRSASDSSSPLRRNQRRTATSGKMPNPPLWLTSFYMHTGQPLALRAIRSTHT